MLKIDDFLSTLTHAHPGMREIWLLAAPEKTKGRHGSAWKLLVFANEITFQQLRGDVRFKRADVELLVVRDGDAFRDPWNEKSEPGYLSEWEWVRTSEREAQYYGTKWVQDEKLGRAIVELCKASLLWPAEKS